MRLGFSFAIFLIWTAPSKLLPMTEKTFAQLLLSPINCNLTVLKKGKFLCHPQLFTFIVDAHLCKSYFIIVWQFPSCAFQALYHHQLSKFNNSPIISNPLSLPKESEDYTTRKILTCCIHLPLIIIIAVFAKECSKACNFYKNWIGYILLAVIIISSSWAKNKEKLSHIGEIINW